ncbi:all-trans-retinol 13,14-reductase [Chitinophaga costaii]|uniref:All-trans-retinol 13,14-reductase n=1 Tax=Chitinophaga costaii TaxID=1335309 RepID=A0A1C3ZGN7_9BACT|nr:NAD(P)/FAD-dependent oxidoreductase [Chitinophaga costaii]PUZ30364.1 NAD(P)/FAD-dependent oxidoreductase [Chitinophaga costaii]SCB81488.1 all-trans-retinol 13,14-reductase [Chitinophaga costaii]
MNTPTVAIIGSGLGGLVCGALLAKHGYRVSLYEKNKQIGGCLQTFSRDKAILDSGVHYIGGLDKGQTLHEVFRYLGIMDKLQLQKMDVDGFDVINFCNEDKEYKLAQGYNNFKACLLSDFPGEAVALDAYCQRIKDICSKFPLYNLRLGSYSEKESVLAYSTTEFLESITHNERLRQVLAGNNLLYAGKANKTPLYVHALVTNSFIESSYKCVDGGSQIARLLYQVIRENGGAVHRNAPVTNIVCDNMGVDHLRLLDGSKVQADLFISNMHPLQTIQMTDSPLLRNAYKLRIGQLENSPGAFVLNLTLKPHAFPYLNYNYYAHTKNDAWAGIAYTKGEWPLTWAMFVPPGKAVLPFADNLTIMTYMNAEDLDPWKNTFNTTAHPSVRHEGYQAFKAQKTQQLLEKVYLRFPALKNAIQHCYAATPLTYRDYIGTSDGSMYGVEKDYHDTLKTFISTRTRLSNLYLTGQNLNLHGIMGVTMSAVMTCGEIIGMEPLLGAIKQHSL